MINRVVLAGRLTRNPELRKTGTGTSICQFSLAVQRTVKKEGTPDADFINCVAFGKTAELICQYQVKGNLIGIDGKLQSNKYEKNGEMIYSINVLADSVSFLTPKAQQNVPETSANVQNTYGYTNTPQTQQSANNNVYLSDIDTTGFGGDDYPF